MLQKRWPSDKANREKYTINYCRVKSFLIKYLTNTNTLWEHARLSHLGQDDPFAVKVMYYRTTSY